MSSYLKTYKTFKYSFKVLKSLQKMKSSSDSFFISESDSLSSNPEKNKNDFFDLKKN